MSRGRASAPVLPSPAHFSLRDNGDIRRFAMPTVLRPLSNDLSWSGAAHAYCMVRVRGKMRAESECDPECDPERSIILR